MPIEVDSANRRQQIGDAGLRVVRDRGITGLTVRAVAAEMGGSTSLVTNYVRNRSELLDLTLESVLRQWDIEADELIGSAGDGLEKMAAWAVDWYSGFGPIAAAMVVQVLAEQTPEQNRLATLRRELESLHRQLLEATQSTDTADSDLAADVLYLITRGAMVTSVEDPDRWPTDRLTRAATHVARQLRSRPDPR